VQHSNDENGIAFNAIENAKQIARHDRNAHVAFIAFLCTPVGIAQTAQVKSKMNIARRILWTATQR
jgi:hypothetical protein